MFLYARLCHIVDAMLLLLLMLPPQMLMITRTLRTLRWQTVHCACVEYSERKKYANKFSTRQRALKAKQQQLKINCKESKTK